MRRPIDDLRDRAEAAWRVQLRAGAHGRPLPNGCILSDVVATAARLFTSASPAPRLRIDAGVERLVLGIEPVTMVAVLWCAASSLRESPWPTAASVQIDGHAEDERVLLLLHDHAADVGGSTWNTGRGSTRAHDSLLSDSLGLASSASCSPVHHDWRTGVATIALDLPKFGARLAAGA